MRTAIEVELERSGQIYLVHNRVESIYDLAARIRELVPQARVVVAHGQMGESDLEKVMLAFMRHEFDVLVATTIIENGLDIPLANTILINRADRPHPDRAWPDAGGGTRARHARLHAA
jgi:transcription-repair coupling factor (superfamily II helicase)